MSRNTGGVYTLPGVPFVNGTVADAGTVNAKFADLATEMTDSLSRSGKGGMTGALRLAEGSDPLPALAFTADTSVGLRYDVGSGEFRALMGGDAVQAWSLTQVLINQPLTISGALEASGTLRVGNGSSSAPALAFGADTDTGLYRAGSADVRLQIDATQVQRWTATAVTINQPLTAAAGTFNFGVTSTGPAGTAGGVFANGTAATGAAPQNALSLTNGYLGFSGVTNPNKDVAFTNIVTPKNVCKAWAYITIDTVNTPTLHDGFNMGAVSITPTSDTLTVAWAQAFPAATYACVASSQYDVAVASQSTTGATFRFYDRSSATAVDLDVITGMWISIVVFAAQ